MCETSRQRKIFRCLFFHFPRIGLVKGGSMMEQKSKIEQQPFLLTEQERVSRRNKEKCVAFLVKMIEKYGKEVLEELQEKEETNNYMPTTAE